MWGHGDEIFTANSAGQLLHFDGSVVELELSEFDAVHKPWGVDGAVYFISNQAFGRYSAAEGVEMIHLFDDVEWTSFQSIWGRSASEVFVSVHDQQLQPYECGGAVMLWFDGQQLHRF